MEISEYKNIFDNERSHFYYVGTHNAVIKFLDLYLSKRRNNIILDAGCGTGELMKNLSKFGKVYGIDINDEALKFTSKNHIKNVKKASITNIPFQDNKFDVVVSIDVLYHKAVKNDLEAFNEFKRVLKPGGILIIKSPAHDWLRGSHDVVIHTKRRYSKIQLVDRLKKTGFETLKLSYINISLLPIAIIKRLSESILKSKPSSDVGKLPKLVNNTFLGLYNWETRIITKTTIPFGLSLFAIARKPYN